VPVHIFNNETYLSKETNAVLVIFYSLVLQPEHTPLYVTRLIIHFDRVDFTPPLLLEGFGFLSRDRLSWHVIFIFFLTPFS